jgi:hypothetical protein
MKFRKWVLLSCQFTPGDQVYLTLFNFSAICIVIQLIFTRQRHLSTNYFTHYEAT